MEMNRAILRFALTGLVAALLAGSAPSWSQTPAPEAGAKAYALPAELLRAAKRWKVDLKDVTIAVLPVDDVRRTEKDSNVTRVRPVLLHRADVSVAPASSAKVVTTLVALETLGKLTPSAVSTVEVDDLRERYEEAMNDDLNSPLVIAALFDWVRIINQIYEKQQSITAEDLDRLRVLVHTVVFDVLGLCDEKAAEADDLVTPLVEMLLDVRAEAKAAKNWAASDRIRDRLNEIGIRVKDRKDGCDWEIE